MRKRSLALALAFGAACFGVFQAPARAAGTPLYLCNKTSATITVAVGYRSSGVNDTDQVLTGPFVSRGWWDLTPGECQSFTNPFSARYMYWWGYGADHYPRQNGNSYFCVPNTSIAPPRFTFEDQNESQSACTSADAVGSGGPNMWVGARKVDVEVDASDEYD